MKLHQFILVICGLLGPVALINGQGTTVTPTAGVSPPAVEANKTADAAAAVETLPAAEVEDVTTKDVDVEKGGDVLEKPSISGISLLSDMETEDKVEYTHACTTKFLVAGMDTVTISFNIIAGLRSLLKFGRPWYEWGPPGTADGQKGKCMVDFKTCAGLDITSVCSCNSTEVVALFFHKKVDVEMSENLVQLAFYMPPENKQILIWNTTLPVIKARCKHVVGSNSAPNPRPRSFWSILTFSTLVAMLMGNRLING